MTWVKICGMTNLQDALIAIDAGADAVGFVFYEKSPRCVSVETVREIVERLPAEVEKIGVFVDTEAARIREVVLSTDLTAVQLHGKQSLESVVNDSRTIPECLAVSKAIMMVQGDALQDGGVFIGESVCAKMFALLVDSESNGATGGTGVTFNWQAARDMVRALTRLLPVIVAGGLTPSNIGEAMRAFQPFGVDVTSGVEARPGKKDPDKVRAFVKAVRDFDRKVG
jgi:phosphoribosylanthranilate isomerase